MCICELNFVGDIVLIFNDIQQAKQLLHSVERECSKVGVGLSVSSSVKMTKGMFFNVDG